APELIKTHPARKNPRQMGFSLGHVSVLVLVLVRSDIIASALRTRTGIEVGRRGYACTRRALVNRRRTCLLVIIARAIRLPVDKSSSKCRIHGDVIGMYALVTGASFETIVPPSV